MALWLSRFSTDRIRRVSGAPSERPLALYAKSKNAFALTAVDARAAQFGITAGLSLADARAICPELDTREADVAADAAELDRIASWCERFTPVVVLDPPNGLFLDITGCAHLFGGEGALLTEVTARLGARSFVNCAAIAPTPGAAWALARFRGRQIVEQESLREALAPLPVEALRLAPTSSALLKRAGLKTIGQMLNTPRAALAARLGQSAIARLDQAVGRAQEALTPRRPSPPFFASLTLAEPVVTLDAVMHLTEKLCADLCVRLDAKGMGAQALLLSVFGVDGAARRIALKLSRPERAPQTMFGLFKEKLERDGANFNAEFGFEAARLDAFEIAPWIFRTIDLAPADASHDPDAEPRLVDRLAARLGAERIGKLCVSDAHMPERAGALTTGSAMTAGKASTATIGLAAAPLEDGVMRRPLTLFPSALPIEALAAVPDGPPLRFRWRRVLRNVVRAEGPERIAPGALISASTPPRDYYRLEDAEGRRYWVYREGFYDAGAPPRWFLHGLFA